MSKRRTADARALPSALRAVEFQPTYSHVGNELTEQTASARMKRTQDEQRSTMDNSDKSILARGCDPIASLEASRAIPPLIGNPEYVPTTDDNDFLDKLRSRTWSVVFFAPGACRFSAARMSIPGGNTRTEGWTLEQYRELVREYQGPEIQIVETLAERDAVRLLAEALAEARQTH